ncbi:hypothetical protein Ancab_023651, partial [Ancistrocladus abbreviatus]
EEIHRNRPEKGEHKCREIHAPWKEGDPNLVINSRDASSQDKTENSKFENEQRVQKILRGKAEHRGTAECSRCAGEQVSQKQDGTSGDTPLRFLFQRQRKIKKRCIPSKAPSTQTSDGEGKGHRADSGGPTFVGPTSTKEGMGFTRGDKAHLIREPSEQGMLAPRGNRRKLQQLSQLRFYTLPRNRKKLSMMRGGRRIPAKKNKKGRSTDISGSLSSRQLQTDINMEGTSIGDSDIANMNKVIHRQQEELEAQQIWEFGKRVGAHAEGREEEVGDRIRELEEWDHKNWDKMMVAPQHISTERREVSIK